MDLHTYLTRARQRLLDEEGFVPAEAHLPDELRPYVPVVMVNRAEDDAVLLALIPADDMPQGARADLLTTLAGMAERFAARGRCLLIGSFLFNGALRPDDIDQIQGLKREYENAGVTVLPWIVDLETGIVARHEGPPSVAIAYRTLASMEAEAETRTEQEEVAQHPAHLRRPEEPRVTYAILGIVILLFGLIMIRGGGMEATQDERILIGWGAAHRPSIWLEGQWWRVASAAFLHFGPLHLAFNGFALYQLGRMVEWLFGHWRYALIFATAALAGSAASLYLNFPLAVSAGASGGLYGLFGALVFFRLASPLGHYFSWQQILVPIGVNFVFTLTIPNIDAWNHFGGMAGGFVAAAFAGLPLWPGVGASRFALPGRVHTALSGVLVILGLLLVLGRLPLGGPAKSYISGLDQLQRGELAGAETKIREGVRRWDDYWQTHYHLAIALAEQGKTDEAIAAARRAVELESRARPAVELLQRLENR